MNELAVVIGAGANELVAAHHLARAGRRVLVLDERTAADDASAEIGWIPPQILRDLGLAQQDITIHRPDPWAQAPLADGGRLELWHDMARSIDSIRRVSARDAAIWPVFCERMARFARLLERIYTASPPEPTSRDFREIVRLAALALRVRRLGRKNLGDFLRLLPMSVADLLDDWFESDALKGVLGAGGIMHIHQGPRSGGTAFRLLHHHVGSPAGVFRPPLSNIQSVLVQLPSIEIRRARVAGIAVREGLVAGVVLASGEEISAPLVISGADPRRTLLALVDPGWLAPDMVLAAQHIRCRGVVARVMLVLDREPGFSTLVVAPSLDFIERAYDDAKYGRVSRAPYLEARANGAGADGRYRVDVHVQYVPYALADGEWNEARRIALGDLVVEILSRHVPHLGAAVVGRSVLSPRDLEDSYGFPEGQEYHVELALDQAFWMRPLPGWARYRTPVNGLYLCGSGTHPGGGVSGISGHNAAREIMRDSRAGS